MAFLRPFPLLRWSAPRQQAQRAQCPLSLVRCSNAPPSRKRRKTPPVTTDSTTSTALSNEAEAFLISMGVSPEDTRRAISRLPRLAKEPDLAAKAQPILDYLRDELRLSYRQVARVLRHAPHIIFRGTDTFTSRLAFLDTVARIPEKERAATISKCPHILWMDLNTATKVVNLVVEACPLITPASLGLVFARAPQALISSPDRINNNIERIRTAGVTDASSMARVFAKVPLALVYDTHGTVGKRIKYLSEELKLPPPTVGKVLVANPEVLEWSIDQVLRPRVAFLSSLVGEDYIPQTIDKVPFILGVEDAIDRVLWLRETVGLDEAELRVVLRDAPAVLTYSIAGNLTPKWAFLSETVGATKSDVVQAAREMLCANLQQRAMPRYAFLASMGRNDVPVVNMLQGSDFEFCKSVARCDPARYREYVDNDTYLLFFSRLL